MTDIEAREITATIIKSNPYDSGDKFLHPNNNIQFSDLTQRDIATLIKLVRVKGFKWIVEHAYDSDKK